MSKQTEQDDEHLRADPGAVKRIGLRQATIRFAAGALASLIAALVSHFAGPAISGPLLALPAILIASLTLIVDEHGRAAAVDDARGGVLGGLGLVGFAVIASATLGRIPSWLALLAALIAWLVISLAAYGGQRWARHALGRSSR